jgi:hypothetical protein
MRPLGLVVLVTRTLAGQDGPQFDDMFDLPPPAWQLGVRDGLLIAATYAFLYAALVGARKFVEPRRSRIPWKKLRYAIPSTGMLLLGGAFLAGSELLVITATILNLPAILLASPFAVVAADEPPALVVAIWPILWLAWYVIVRLLEVPTWRPKPLSLNLNGPRGR